MRMKILCYDMVCFELSVKYSKYAVKSLNAIWYFILEMHEDNSKLRIMSPTLGRVLGGESVKAYGMYIFGVMIVSTGILV